MALATPLSTAGPHVTHDSYGQSQPTTQTASASVQPFLYRWPQSVPILYSGTLLPPPFIRGSGLHLIHGFLGPPESSTQMASRSAQPFLQGSLVWQTDRQTDRQTTILDR